MALISPLTGNLDINGKVLQNIAAGSVGSPGAYFNNDSNTGLYSSAADIVDITSGGVRNMSLITATTGVNYFLVTPAATTVSPSITATGSDTNVSMALLGKGTGGVTLPAFATPGVANDAYRESVIKGWIKLDGSGTVSILASYNVTSITDNATGNYIITWNRDFATADYAVAGMLKANAGPANGIVATATQAAGTLEIYTSDMANNLTDFDEVTVIAIGAQ